MHAKDRDMNAMGTARFRTVREMCGVDATSIAKWFSVNVRNAQRCDKTHAAPEVVVEWRNQWWETISDHVSEALDELDKNPRSKIPRSI